MEEIIATVIGLLGGIVAGLFPGIHSNTIAEIFSGFAYEAGFLSIIIIAATAGYTVLSLIPAIFLCVPEQSTLLSVLPGQRMVKQGKGSEAIRICALAAFLTTLLTFALIPLSLFLIPSLYNFIKPFLAPILTVVCILFILQEKRLNGILKALGIFFLAGIFGYFILNHPVLKQPLFSSFIGLFALSNLLLTAKNVKLPYQREEKKLKVFIILPIIILGTFLGMMADLLPAVGSAAQMATFGTILVAGNPAHFLALTTSIGISHLVNSFVALHTIRKARIGAVAIIREKSGIPDLSTLLLYLSILFITIMISIALLLYLSKHFIKAIGHVNLKVLNYLLLVYLLAAIFLMDSFSGIGVAAIATSIGVLPPLIGIRRTHLMGFLLIPTLIYLWF